MDATDWATPGMWTLARYRCEVCSRSYWIDLPFNLGVLSPCYLNIEENHADRPGGPLWYRDVTLAAWKVRSPRPVRIERHIIRSVRQICLVNALGNCWGDAIATLAKLNSLCDLTEFGVVVLTTQNLLPHLPAFIAEAWLVDGYTHRDTAEWNDSLTEAVEAEVKRFDGCTIPVIFQLPTVTSSELRSLSGVAPFDRTQWDEQLKIAPTVTFMWRDDRCWAPELAAAHWTNSELAYKRGVGRLIRYWKKWRALRAPMVQANQVNRFAEIVRSALPKIDFGVCGVGRSGKLDSWIKDSRTTTAGPDENRAWCERASRSHLIVGVLGSHMVLPGGHSGGVVDIVPNSFLRNVLTDLLITTSDKREALFLYRTLPLSVTPTALAELVVSILVNYSVANISLNGKYYKPLSSELCAQLFSQNAARMEATRQLSSRSNVLLGP